LFELEATSTRVKLRVLYEWTAGVSFDARVRLGARDASVPHGHKIDDQVDQKSPQWAALRETLAGVSLARCLT